MKIELKTAGDGCEIFIDGEFSAHIISANKTALRKTIALIESAAAVKVGATLTKDGKIVVGYIGDMVDQDKKGTALKISFAQ